MKLLKAIVRPNKVGENIDATIAAARTGEISDGQGRIIRTGEMDTFEPANITITEREDFG